MVAVCASGGGAFATLLSHAGKLSGSWPEQADFLAASALDAPLAASVRVGVRGGVRIGRARQRQPRVQLGARAAPQVAARQLALDAAQLAGHTHTELSTAASQHHRRAAVAARARQE